MNTKKIEEIAVAAVRNEILRSNFLSDEIPVNDKTPSWDGEVWVYCSELQKKEDLYGKVPVQVKGKKVSKFSEKGRKHPIKKVDLENYYNNGGILYVVVEIIDTDHTRIYYQSLLPIDLKEILEELGDKKTITKQFSALPSIPKAFELICRNFIQHSRKQSPNLLLDINQKDFDAYTTKVFISSNKNFNEVFEFGSYVYGHINSMNLDVPLYKIDFSQIIESTDLAIGVNGKIYYVNVARVFKRDKVTIEFGKGFTIELPKKQQNSGDINIKFEEKGRILDRVKDCNFMLQVIKAKGFDLNGSKLHINPIDEESVFLETMPAHINFLEETIKTASQLDISFEMDFDQLTPNDLEKIKMLNEIILYENYEGINYDVQTPFIQFLIGNLKIVLIIFNHNDRRLIIDLFDYETIKRNYNISIETDSARGKVEHSPYIIFNIAELFTISNFKLSAIEKSLKDKDIDYYNENNLNLTNNFLLKALNYYDSNKSDNNLLLEMIIRVYEYIEVFNPKNNLCFINKMQAVRRKREYTVKEKEEIILRKNQGNHSDEVLCGFYILLDSKIEFEILFGKLSGTTQDLFKTYPIYNLKSL